MEGLGRLRSCSRAARPAGAYAKRRDKARRSLSARRLAGAPEELERPRGRSSPGVLGGLWPDREEKKVEEGPRNEEPSS